MKRYQSFHVHQREETECGAACLLSILQYFGGNERLEKIRQLSGTSARGVSLLGLKEAAMALGLEAEGYEAGIPQLRELAQPAILHVVKQGLLPHFVVCYGYSEAEDGFLIGDPAGEQIRTWTEEELTKSWRSRTLLLVKPGKELKEGEPGEKQHRWKWLLQFTRRDYNLLLTSLVIGLFVSALGLSIAIFSQKLVDAILPTGDSIRLLVGGGLLLFLLLIRVFLQYLRRMFLLRQRLDFNIRILDYFYRKLLYLPIPFFHSRKTGDLVARMNDTARIQATVSTIFSTVAIDVLMVIASTVALFAYSISAGLLSLLWLPVFGWIVYRFRDRIHRDQREVMVAYAGNESNYIDTLQGIEAIKSTVGETRYLRKTSRFYTRLQEAGLTLGMTGLGFTTVSQFAAAIFTVGMIIYSSLLVLQGAISIGAVIAIIQLIGLSMGSTSTLAGAFISLQEARVALDRMKAFTELEAEYRPGAGSADPTPGPFHSLEMRGLHFRFTGQPLLLHDLDVSVSRGEIITILGETGCGKSTLLNILQGFYQPEKGDISINGLSINDYPITEIRRMIGIVPQEIKIFNASAMENVTMSEPSEEAMPDFLAFLREYGFDELFRQFPSGPLTILGESGVRISGGQKQQLALARALYRQPGLLLLDEATSAMDRNAERKAWNLLENLRDRMAIVMVTHRVHMAPRADRIYLLEDGTIGKSGTHLELMELSDSYRDMVLHNTLAGNV